MNINISDVTMIFVLAFTNTTLKVLPVFVNKNTNANILLSEYGVVEVDYFH